MEDTIAWTSYIMTNVLMNIMNEIIIQIGNVCGTVFSQSEELSHLADEVRAEIEQIAMTMEEVTAGFVNIFQLGGQLNGLISRLKL